MHAHIDLPGVTPQANGTNARRLVGFAGSAISLPASIYDFGAAPTVRPASGVKVRGAGPEQTIFRHHDKANSANWCCFEGAPGLVYEHLSLETPYGPEHSGEQTCCFGFAAPDYTGITCTLRNVTIKSPTLPVYVWGKPKNTIVLESCDIYFARFGIFLGTSNEDGGYVDLFDCNLVGDYKTWGPGAGIQSMGKTMAALVARGGRVRMYGGSITLIGDPFFDLLVAALTTTAGAPAGVTWGDGRWPIIEMYGVKVSITQNGARDTVDVRQQIGKIADYNCQGTGGGALTRRAA